MQPTLFAAEIFGRPCRERQQGPTSLSLLPPSTMSRPFTPQHAQPVSIASLVELEPDTLTAGPPPPPTSELQRPR